MHKHVWRGWLVAKPRPGEGVGRLIVSPEDMLKFKTIELLLKLCNLLSVCRHERVVTV
jgi:hypothetical protein